MKKQSIKKLREPYFYRDGDNIVICRNPVKTRRSNSCNFSIKTFGNVEGVWSNEKGYKKGFKTQRI